MDRAYVAETWLFYGVGDLYFSFHSDEWVFDHHAAFFSIMAIEKHLKAYILFKRSSEYSSLTEVDAKKKIQSIARKCGHNFEKMVLSCDEFLGADIPQKAYNYIVNGKSAIEWIMERYQIKSDKKSKIENNPNDWAKEMKNPRYILDLLLRIISLSIRTVDIIEQLPSLEFD